MNDIGFKNVLHNVGDISSDMCIVLVELVLCTRFYKGGMQCRFNNMTIVKVS